MIIRLFYNIPFIIIKQSFFNLIIENEAFTLRFWKWERVFDISCAREICISIIFPRFYIPRIVRAHLSRMSHARVRYLGYVILSNNFFEGYNFN